MLMVPVLEANNLVFTATSFACPETRISKQIPVGVLSFGSLEVCQTLIIGNGSTVYLVNSRLRRLTGVELGLGAGAVVFDGLLMVHVHHVSDERQGGENQNANDDEDWSPIDRMVLRKGV